MPNALLAERLKAIQAQLMAHHAGGAMMSTATRGREREYFVSKFLSQVLPPLYRFGSGDIIDSFGQRSGQLDIVIEYPFLPSIPQVVGEERLYLAESVAAVIEVKSDLSAQWDDVERSAAQVHQLRRPRRTLDGRDSWDEGLPNPIPFFAVGYKGWSQMETLRKKLNRDLVNAALVIDGGLFTKLMHPIRQNKPYPYGSWLEVGDLTGSMALWGLIATLQQVTQGISGPCEWLRDYGG